MAIVDPNDPFATLAFPSVDDFVFPPPEWGFDMPAPLPPPEQQTIGVSPVTPAAGTPSLPASPIPTSVLPQDETPALVDPTATVAGEPALDDIEMVGEPDVIRDQDIATVHDIDRPPEIDLGGEPDEIKDEDMFAVAKEVAADPDFEYRQAAKSLELEQMQQAEQLKASGEDLRRAVENNRILVNSIDHAQKKREALVREAEDIANTKIDPRRRYADASGFEKVLSFIGGIAGGMLAARTGGRNQMVDLMLSEIDRDIDAQKANLASRQAGLSAKKTLVSEMFEASGDAFDAAEKARLAMYSQAQNEIAHRMQNLDPRGTTVGRYAEAYRAIEQRKAKAIADYEQTVLDNSIKVGEFELKQRKQMLDERKAAISAAGAGAGRLTDAETQSVYASDVPPMSVQSNPKKLAAWQALKGRAQDITGGGAEGRKIAREDALLLKEKTLPDMPQDETGTPYRARTPKLADEVVTRKAALDSMTTTLAKIRNVKRRAGAEADLWNSAYSQELRSLANDYILSLKDAEKLGALDKGAVDIALGSLGLPPGTDVTEGSASALAKSLVRGDMLRGFDTAYGNAVRKFNNFAKTARDPESNPNFAPYTPTDYREQPEQQTEVGELVKQASKIQLKARVFGAPDDERDAAVTGGDAPLREDNVNAVMELARKIDLGEDRDAAIKGLRELATRKNGNLARFAKEILDTYESGGE